MSCVTTNQSHTVAINRVQVETEFFPPRSLHEKGALQQEIKHYLLLAPMQPPATHKTPGCKFTTHINHRAKMTLGLLEKKSKDGKK